jgi:hypothetical protein
MPPDITTYPGYRLPTEIISQACHARGPRGRGTNGLDLLRKSGGFLMRQEELHDAAETVYEGV